MGVLGACPNGNHFPFPSSAILFKRPCWLITHDYININGSKLQSRFAEALEQIQAGTIITMALSQSGSLGKFVITIHFVITVSIRLFSAITVGQTVVEGFASGLPHHVYPVFDLYGKCEKISIINTEFRNGSPINEDMSIPHHLSEATESLSLIDRNSAPQCREKADLEVHEKETDIPVVNPVASTSSAM